MTNQNRRSGELEVRLEAPPMSDTMGQLGSFQFLILQDLEEVQDHRRKRTRKPAKGKCRAMWKCQNKNLDGLLGVVCKKSTGHSATEIKSNPSKTKCDLSDDCENTHSSQASLSTRASSDVEICTTSKDSRQPCYDSSDKRDSSQAEQNEEDNERHPLSGKEQSGDGSQDNQKDDMSFPFECFAQLYKRIEALEGLLQRGLDTFSKEACECKETNKPRKSEQQNTAKLLPQTNPPLGCDLMRLPELFNQVLDSSFSGVPETATNEEKETAQMKELQNIKGRLIALEEKMKRLKLSATQSNLNLQTSSKNTLALTKVEKRNTETSEKQIDSPTQTYSEPESPLQSEILFLNTSLNHSTDWKIKNKANKKVRKCKKIKTDCSSEHSSKKSCCSRKGSITVLNCPSDISAPRTRSFDSTLFRYPICMEQEWDKTKSPAGLYFKCKNAAVAWPSSKCLETRPKKVKDLCRKVPVMNFVLSQYSEKEITDPHAYGDCKFLSSPRKCGRLKRKSKGHLLSKPSPTGLSSSQRRHMTWTVAKRSNRHPQVIEDLTPQKTKHRERERRRDKYELNSRSTGNPKEMLNENDKIKIPVLFKEICKPMKPIQKISNVSMRFVLVENDSKTPLKSLLQKMSKERPQNRAEQYLFGVSKCSCDELQPLYLNFP